MTRRRFYQPAVRPVRASGMSKVMRLHTRLTTQEVEQCMTPLLQSFNAIREARATHAQWLVLNSHFLISQEIENQGVVRGLQGHIAAALAASQTYAVRSGEEENWKPSALYFSELDAMSTMLEMHQFQIEQLSAHELQTATKRLTSRTLSQHGQGFVTESDLTPFKQQERKRA